MRIPSRMLLAICMATLVMNCGGSGTSTTSSSSTTSTSSVALATIDELPNSLNPVEASSSSSLSLSKGSLYTLATTGVALGDDPEELGVLEQGSSMGACTAFNMTKEAINQASMGALILCYVQSIFGASDTSIDIYDGEFHTFGMDFTGVGGGEGEEEEDGQGPSKVRFKIVKDADDAITDFVMYACGDSGEADEQSEYLSQTIDGSTFAMTEKGTHADSFGEYNWSSTVDGTLAANGNFTGTKTIDINFDSTWLNGGDEIGGGNGSITFEQGSDTADLSGFMTGTSTFGQDAFTYEDVFVGAMQLLDGNEDDADYNIGLLAMGIGCVSGETGGTWTDDGEAQDWDEAYTDCWNETWGTEETNEFLTDVEDATLPTASAQTVGFEGDEVYDCADEPEATLVIADLGVDFNAACANFQLGHQHIDCWSTIQVGSEDDQGGGGGDNQDQNNNQDDQGGNGDLSDFNISSCNGSPSASDAMSEAAGTALCVCMEEQYGADSVPCEEFGSICSASPTVGDCVTALQSGQ